jgi:hypothetical protein
MQLIRRFWPRETVLPDRSLDLETLFETARRDPATVRPSIRLLDQERRALERRRASIDDQFHRMTPRQLKNVARTRASFPQLETNMLADAMQDVDPERETQRANQLAAIDERLRLLEDARRRIGEIAR